MTAATVRPPPRPQGSGRPESQVDPDGCSAGGYSADSYERRQLRAVVADENGAVSV